MLRRDTEGVRDPYRIVLGGEKIEKQIYSARRYSLFLFVIMACGVAFLAYIIFPPRDFVPQTQITIKEGSSVRVIAEELKANHLIRSQDIFMLLSVMLGYDKTFVSGSYHFDEAPHIFTLIKRIGAGMHGIEIKNITVPEGLSRNEMVSLLKAQLPAFSGDDFLFLSQNDEGYLFPDTYTFFATATSGEVYERMRKNFDEKTHDAQMIAAEEKRDFHDILTLASIVEEEAVTEKDRKIVAGIFLERLRLNMPLQADATFQYINGKGSLELTLLDLKEDSPYNTYTNKGLPPTPIVSPSLESINAVLSPTPSAYLFYLSDKDGVIHYAKTFEEHKLNKTRYLK